MNDLVSIRSGYVNIAGHSLRVTHWQAPEPKEYVLMIPPLGEEMHFSRRHLAAISHRLAQIGLSVLLYDPPGMGETISSSDATGFRCHSTALSKLVRKCDFDSMSLISFRAGILATLDLSAVSTEIVRHITFEPILDGARYARTLLRQQLLAARLKNLPALSVEEMQTELRAGATVKVGGLVITGSYYDELCQISMPKEGYEYLPTHFIFLAESNSQEHTDLPGTSRFVSGNRFWAIEDGDATGLSDALIDIYSSI